MNDVVFDAPCKKHWNEYRAAVPAGGARSKKHWQEEYYGG